jgi:hypothetical protein
VNLAPVLLLFVAGLIAILVLGYLVTNNMLKPPFLRPATILWHGFIGLYVLLVLVFVGYAVSESGWIPRTREVLVWAKAQRWMIGEIKTCVSSGLSKEDMEIEALVCDEENFEHHVLQVKFWGPIKADRTKQWKCTREQESLTCKLQ